MPANHYWETHREENLADLEKAREVMKFNNTSRKSLTDVGTAALRYVKNPSSFPSDCPDPRQDAEGFADYILRHQG